MDNIYLFLTNDGELDNRARRDRLQLEAAEQLGRLRDGPTDRAGAAGAGPDGR